MGLTLLTKPPSNTGGKVPLMVEIPVEAELAPFLVSSSKDVLWVERSHQGHARAAVRKATVPELDRQFIGAVRTRGADDGWGNVHPMTLDGLRAGVAHLSEYGFTDLDYFVSVGGTAPTAPGLSPLEASWVPSGHAVLLPKNREYVGVTLDFGHGNHATVIHNAARGVVVLVA